MIIACEKCATRFQLDDARVPLDGVKVRCSKCRHAFVVHPAGALDASDREAAAGHAQEAARRVRAEKPAAPASGGQTQMLERPAPRPESAGDEEDDWQFNEDPGPDGGDSDPGHPPRAAAPADPIREFLGSEEESRPPERASLDSVGSPDEWDLVGDDAPSPAAEPPPARAEVEPVARKQAPAAPAATPARARAAAPRADEPTELEHGPIHSRPVEAAGWLAVLALVALTAWTSLVPRATATRSAPGVVEVDGLRVEELRARILENAVAGPLLVVSGRLRNPQAEPRLAGGVLTVRLLDASGRPLEGPLAGADMAFAPEEQRLRTEAPELLADALAAGAAELAQRPLGPGEAFAVAALFPEPPPEARAFRIERGPMPQPPPSWAASPPTPPPSSE